MIVLYSYDTFDVTLMYTHRVNKNPTSVFKKVENCNYAVNICKEMKFSIVNIGGNDIVQGQKKLILAIIWQLMRKLVICWLLACVDLSMYPLYVCVVLSTVILMR